MQEYKILVSFLGSNTGIDCVKYEAGTIGKLSKSLAETAINHGWIAPLEDKPKKEVKVAIPKPAEEKPKPKYDIFKERSKLKLEEKARELYDIELDRRKSLANMKKDLKELMK